MCFENVVTSRAGGVQNYGVRLADRARIGWQLHIMTRVGKQLCQQRRRGVVVKIELHELRIRATSSGGTIRNLPPNL